DVAGERMQQNQSGAIPHTTQNGIASRARHATPAVKSRNYHHFKWNITGQVSLDVFVDNLVIVFVAPVLVSVVVTDTPAVDVPFAVDLVSGWGELKSLHQLDHVATVLD